MKNRFSVVKIPITVLLLVVTLGGCSTTRYGVEINNVQNIREFYIKNAGATSWSTNMVNNMQDIERSSFSERVDIRVIDTNGLAYSKYNVPFSDAAFGEPSKTSSLNPVAGLVILGIGLGALYFLMPKEEK